MATEVENTAERPNFGKEFEDEVKIFLTDTLQLHDVKGGPGFNIADDGERNQIDVCGRFGDILFIFECKAAGRKVKKSMRQDILATHTRAKMAWENFRKIPEYASCKTIRYIFITKRIELPESEKELFKGMNQPSVFYADEQMLEYYTDLKEKIGEYATYNFLSDFKVYPPAHEQLRVPAMRAKLGNYVVYSFYVEPKKLLKFAYVARRRKQKEDFYQRMLDKTRIKKIKNFLDSGGVFPTNVVISLKDGEKSFEKIGTPGFSGADMGMLTISGSYNACWIVDGQHRLYSYSDSQSNIPLSCIAFDSLSIEDERRFFLEINKEQKPIQPDLIWDLEGLSNPESPRGIISNIVRTLDDRQESPFFGNIYIPVRGSKAGKIINMAAFCNGLVNAGITKQMTSNCIGIMNPLFVDRHYTMTKRAADVLTRYFSLLNEKLSGEHREFVFGNAGVPIMLYLLEPIVARIGRIPSFNDLEDYTATTAEFLQSHFPDPKAIRTLRQDTNSEGARKNIAKQIGIYIRRQLKDPDFWPQMEQDETVLEIIEMERRLADLIANELSAISSGWETQRVPQEIHRVAKKRAAQDGTTFAENLDLADALQIITQPNNWNEVFSKLFQKKEGFLGQDELKIAFNYMGKIRNPSAHGKTITYSKEDLAQCELYLQKLDRVVPEVLETEATLTETVV